MPITADAMKGPIYVPNYTRKTSSGNVTMSDEGGVIVDKTSGAATTVTLPANPENGWVIFVKDGKGDAGTNNITISPSGSQTIEGQTSLVISENYGGVMLAYDSDADWKIVSQLSSPLTGAGAVAGTGVTVQELGNAAVHKTVITLSSAAVPITSTTTANGFGGLKVYDLPEGYIRILGCTAALSIAVDAAEQANFTDGTPEGDIGIGTVIIANADALGTDATDDDLGTGAAFTMSSYADADIDIPPEAAQNLDGTTTAKDVNVNVLVDAADIDDDATTEVEVSGTITLHWINLGDY